MEVKTDEQKKARRNRLIRWLAGIFTVMMIGFTLLGNTIQGFMLPKVVITEVTKGTLVHSYKGGSTLQYEDERELINPAGWKVSKVLVKEGDKVQKGQTLIEYDDSQAAMELSDAQGSLEKLQLSLDQQHFSYKVAVQSGDEAGRIAAKNAMDSANIDIQMQEQHIEMLEHNLTSNRRLLAPFDGIITSVGAEEGFLSSGGADIRLANTAKGYRFELQIPDDVAELLTKGETLDALLPQKNQTVKGKITNLENGSSMGPSMDSSMDSSMNSSGGNAPADSVQQQGQTKVTVAVQGKELRGGEPVQVSIEKSQKDNEVLVPSDAVHKDSTGDYVYTINQRQGPLGNAYYVVRTPVKVSGTSAQMTAVSEGLFDKQQIILDTDGPIMEGNRVRY